MKIIWFNQTLIWFNQITTLTPLKVASDADEPVFSQQGDRKPSHLRGGTGPAGLAALPHTDTDQPSSPLLSPSAPQVGTGADCRAGVRQEADTVTLAAFLSGFLLGAADR